MFLSILALFPLLFSSITHVVDANGGGDFLTIQAAIDTAQTGDSIRVMPGVYEEDLAVDVSITIFADTDGSVVIYPATHNPGSGFGSQVDSTTQSCKIQADAVTLEGLIFDGDNPNLSGGIDARNGIICDYSLGTWNDLTVRRCEARNILHRAIYASRGAGHLFDSSTAENVNGVGLESAGFMFFGASGSIYNCVAKNCGIGISTHAGSAVHMISGNRVENSMLGILCNGTANTQSIFTNTFVDCDQGVQLIAINAHCDIKYNTFLRNHWGVSFFGSNASANISENIFNGDGRVDSVGIQAMTDLAPWGVNDVTATVYENQFINLYYGIILDETIGLQHETITLIIGDNPAGSNLFANNREYNIYLENCDDDINATSNSWGTTDVTEMGDMIYDYHDSPELGRVDSTYATHDLFLTSANLAANELGEFSVTCATPLSPVMLAVSTLGAGPESSPYGDILLTSPHFMLPNMTASAGGHAKTHIMVDPNYAGRTFWLQAFDLASKTLTNGIEVVVRD